jgi:hypothetical protein
MSFLLGTIPVPLPTDPLFHIWERCNTLITSWLLNSVSPSIAQSIIYFDRAIEKDFIIRFLNGLDDRFSVVKSQILLLDPLPQTYCVFSMVIQQERQHTSISSTIDEPNSFVNAAGASGRSKPTYSSPRRSISNKDKDVVCDYCHCRGHTADVCFSRNGYPPGHPRYPGRPRFNPKPQSSSTTNNVTVVSSSSANGAANSSGQSASNSPNFGFTQAQVQLLMGLLQQA